MEIVDLVVEYASGLSISDRATYLCELRSVHPSSRVIDIMRGLSGTEAPPSARALIDGEDIQLDQCDDGTFVASDESGSPMPASFVARHIGHEWTKDKRQQFGRYLHTLSAASGAGAAGYWHSTDVWTGTAVFNLTTLLVLFVILFLAGMDSMNGD
ncbi:hypothetical protein [Burkholderia sp. MSMB1498]|uniref:hypothetical protein n=1 Tax=Burkholderia sp. MSMB1498 TaxID=1637842 RepID=UPI0007529CAB|nr:hypothetical protein [Burkholderia sp. MSMB1498]KVK79023.1 hypothetical protein WS91_14145 [Burkholderia sp. MSMB1498]